VSDTSSDAVPSSTIPPPGASQLDVAREPHVDDEGEVFVPRQLPPVPRHFTNRRRELDELNTELTTSTGQMPILVLTGTGGVGKTTLAVWWSSHISDRFPDGVLYVNMGAFDPNGPLSPDDALGHFLRSLGASSDQIPMLLEERAALFRSMTRRKTLLMLLDNVTSASQVRPLLPASDQCVVIITARSRMDGLILDGARLVNLDPLDDDAAVDLISSVVPPKRLNAERAATVRLVARCAGLPIALSIAAARLAARPRLSVGRVAEELDREHSRMGALSIRGELSVQAVFDVSYRRLPPNAARLYRLLGLHPGESFSAYVACALLDKSKREADDLLDVLVEASMINEVDEERFAFHDLVRLHARQCADAEETHDDRVAAVGRILDFYISAASRADQLINLLGRVDEVAGRTTKATPNFSSHSEAIAWVDVERRNVLASFKLAIEFGLEPRAVRLANSIIYFLRLMGYWNEALDMCRDVTERCAEGGDPAALADLTFYCGDIHRLAGSLPEARSSYERAIATYESLGDRYRTARALHSIGDIERADGHYDVAVEQYAACLDIYRGLSIPIAEARALHSIADAYRLSGRHDDAIAHYGQLLDSYRDLDDKVGAARVQHSIGDIIAVSGRYEEALENCNRALSVYRDLGDRLGEADALRSIGAIHATMDDHAASVRFYEDAEVIYRSLRNLRHEAMVLREMGRSLVRLGRDADARVRLRRALEILESAGAEEAEAVRAEIDGISS
jgi:tetratricopeptide (TPR) repeat protein